MPSAETGQGHSWAQQRGCRTRWAVNGVGCASSEPSAEAWQGQHTTHIESISNHTRVVSFLRGSSDKILQVRVYSMQIRLSSGGTAKRFCDESRVLLAIPLTLLVLGAGCQRPEGNQSGECRDNLDNDGDGAVDCYDPDCAAAGYVDIAEHFGRKAPTTRRWKWPRSAITKPVKLAIPTAALGTANFSNIVLSRRSREC